jgi:S-adenosylmethionine:tRNA ribosyltransferase-isomerase
LLLGRGDLLVLNDSATLPASLEGDTESAGRIELRLVGEDRDGSWRAVLFSEGNWRVPTERRPAPPRLDVGSRLTFAALAAKVEAISSISPRLIHVRFDTRGAAFWTGLYRSGKVVQYAYLNGPLQLWHVQNRYAGCPWAAEAPSAGFGLTGRVLAELRRRGILLATLTHAAGLSATGDPPLDAALPLEERYDIPAECVRAVTDAQSSGKRVIAVGTSVVRALESAVLEGTGTLRAGMSRTQLRIGPGFRPRIVDGLLSGIHDPTESHYALLQAFTSREHLDRATVAAQDAGYLAHEFGDLCLML